MNEQKAESLAIGQGFLDVESIFKTIQGEGPFAGTPAIFIRLAGCNLQCPRCDTDYTSHRRRMVCKQVVDEVCNKAEFVTKLVVITGGEPFRQPLRELTDQLFRFGFKIQIETNGTLFQHLNYERVTVVCSPKTGCINPRLRPHIEALKYVLSADAWDLADGLPTTALGLPIARKLAKPWPDFEGIIYLQPADDGNNECNLSCCIENCLRFGYRLCLQMHKICHLP